MVEEEVKVTLSERGIAGRSVVSEKRQDGALVLKPDHEKLSDIADETDGKVFRDEEFVEHLARVSEAEDDLGDYEPE
ncbi:hypothetical protein AYO39_00555 [Actinobacteria bacterium SCGC AG-212-D09]|nr:hypothetical protein AYO39_00555 [Actinobacteria bacterium SCGC AG-212-D09]